MGSERHPQSADGRDRHPVSEPPLLTIAFAEPAPGVLLVTVDGELDLASAPELDARVRHEVHERQPRRLIVDLARLRFLGLHGIAVFERLRRNPVTIGSGIALVALPPAGRRALEFTGVLPMFDRYPDVATALRAAPPANPGVVRTPVTPPAAKTVHEPGDDGFRVDLCRPPVPGQR